MSSSYSRGPSGTLLDLTIGQQLRQTAAKFGDRPALISRHQDVRLSWRELDGRVSEWAAGLRALGLAPEDRVGVWSTNCVEWVLLQMACARSGLVLSMSIPPTVRMSSAT